MTGALKRAPSPGFLERDAPDAKEAMVRFSITPTHDGAWRWRTFDRDGGVRTQGLAASRKQAAALVIRDIMRARCEPAAPPIPKFPAKAA